MTTTFRALHAQPDLLILPNAWDPGSARLFEKLGAKAIATTSAGVAWSLGYADGNKLPVDEVVRAAAAIRRAIAVPLSFDSEAGYSSDPHAVAELAKRLVDAGVDGINLEDGADAPEVLARKIEAIKATVGDQLFVNARTDVFLASLVGAERAVDETIARGATYRDAGADGLFVPAVVRPEQIRAIVAAVALPINVLAWSGLPAAPELTALGVKRLTAGSAIAQSMIARAQGIGLAFLETGRSDVFDSAASYAFAQSLWSR